MQFLSIILLSISAAVFYGIVHDQATARICVEYFTIGHPPVFKTADPTLLGIGWGIIATWWVGLLLGVPLAMTARLGERPKRTAGSLIRPFAWLLGVMAACALLAGIAGWLLSSHEAVFLVGPLAERVPREKHVAFIADLWAHSASYIAGFAGGIVLILLVWRSRRKLAESSPHAPRESATGGSSRGA
jgi:hypothetical protein